MLIKFSRDYRGKLTNELFYVAGTEVDIDDGAAMQIVAQGAAVVVGQPTEEQPVEDAPKPTRRKRKSAEE